DQLPGRDGDRYRNEGGGGHHRRQRHGREEVGQSLLDWEGVDVDAVGIVAPVVEPADAPAGDIGQVQDERSEAGEIDKEEDSSVERGGDERREETEKNRRAHGDPVAPEIEARSVEEHEDADVPLRIEPLS